MSALADPRKSHPIQVVARRTGLSAELIRVWERRYGAVEPRRSDTNRRIYTDEDIERLRLLRLATLGGRRIGDVSALPDAELQELISQDQVAPTPSTGPPSPPGRKTKASDHLKTCLAAVDALDSDSLESALANAGVSLSQPVLVEELLMPLATAIGDRWREGTLRVSQEHMATAVLRSVLSSLRAGQRTAQAAPELIVGTPAGQHHELGALAAAAAASLDGWRVTYLGPDLPSDEIAMAVQMRQALVVALSVVFPADDPRLASEMRTLRRLVGNDVALVVGGSAADAYAEVLRETGALVRQDFSGLRAALEQVRSQGRQT